jgi:hypothetical protein
MASPLQEIAYGHANALAAVVESLEEQNYWLSNPHLEDRLARREIEQHAAENYARLALVIKSWVECFAVITNADEVARQAGTRARNRLATH